MSMTLSSLHADLVSVNRRAAGAVERGDDRAAGHQPAVGARSGPPPALAA